MSAQTMEQIVSLAKRRGFIFPGSDVYGGLQGTYDYGPLGIELKNNLKRAWWHVQRLRTRRHGRHRRIDLDEQTRVALFGTRGNLCRSDGRLPQLQRPLPRRSPEEQYLSELWVVAI